MAVNTLRKASAVGVHLLYLGALPYFVMGAIVAVELSPQRYMGFLCLLSLGPVLASVSRRAAATAVIGAEAVALSIGVSWYDHFYERPHWLVATITIVAVAAVGVVASAGRQRAERELRSKERELAKAQTDANAYQKVADAVQRVLLHAPPSDVPGARIAVRYMSAMAEARIGGDLYEVISTPSWVRLIVGDVQGKGLDAVRTANMVLGAYREAAYEAADLVEIAARIERSMGHQVPEQEFVTAVLAEIRPGRDEIEILSCGHPAPLLARGGDAEPAEPPDPGLPLGLSSLGAGRRVSQTCRFGPGDQVLFYTDGISEARDATGAFFPMSLCGPILADSDPEAALDKLRDQVIRHVGHTLTDDAAMLLVSCTASGTCQAIPAQAAPGGTARAATVASRAVAESAMPTLDGVGG